MPKQTTVLRNLINLLSSVLYYYIFWVCAYSLRIQHAMRCAILSSVACPTVQYFPTLFYKRNIFEKKMSLYIKGALRYSVQLLSEIFLIPRRTERDMIKNVNQSLLKYPLLLSDFNEIWVFSIDFRKPLKFHISWKSIQWEQSCSMRTERQTNRRTDRHDETYGRFS